jgi:uncharacterized protein DUF2510
MSVGDGSIVRMGDPVEMSDESIRRGLANTETNTDHFRRVCAEPERERQQIVEHVDHSDGLVDDLAWPAAHELYRAGLISAGELHATGSPGLLPRGWYYHYVDGIGSCPTRVWGADEHGDEPKVAELYAQGYRWITVFSDATGASGDWTFIHTQTFAAAAMTENPLDEQWALDELAHMGYLPNDLPAGIRMHRPATVADMLPAEGWYPDPTGRFQHRWWDGRAWAAVVSYGGRTLSDPL